MKNLQIRIVLKPNDVKRLAGKARGYFREDARKDWKESEYLEAARLAITQLVFRELEIPSAREYYKELNENA